MRKMVREMLDGLLAPMVPLVAMWLGGTALAAKVQGYDLLATILAAGSLVGWVVSGIVLVVGLAAMLADIGRDVWERVRAGAR